MSRINTNVSSLATIHRLQANQKDLNLRLERLATGLRVNRGADDPAGLIASETLRGEITAISQALDNSARAINVLATTEAALNEISALLLELQDLIVNSANDAGLSENEIEANQLQIDSILESIDRISNSTQFGGKKLLNGTLDYSLSGVSSATIADTQILAARVPAGRSMSVVVEVTSAASRGMLTYTSGSPTENLTFAVTGQLGTATIAITSGQSLSSIANAINTFTAQTGVEAVVSGTDLVLQSTKFGSDAFVKVKALKGDFIATEGSSTQDSGSDVGVLINGIRGSADGLTASARGNGLDVTVNLTEAFGTSASTTTFTITGGGALFQIGPQVNANGQVHIGVGSVATSELGDNVDGFLSSLATGQDNALDTKNFQQAQIIIENAISEVARMRGRLGALQRNTIETNVNSLRVALENVKSSESTIRDADFAEEVSALTRAQILMQSSTAILGLANQLPQNVLSLLG